MDKAEIRAKAISIAADIAKRVGWYSVKEFKNKVWGLSPSDMRILKELHKDDSRVSDIHTDFPHQAIEAALTAAHTAGKREGWDECKEAVLEATDGFEVGHWSDQIRALKLEVLGKANQIAPLNTRWESRQEHTKRVLEKDGG